MNIDKRLNLADMLPREKNNFDLIRLIAAIGVIFGHSFYLFQTGGYQEPVTQLVERNFTGTLSVGVFFFLSGILVTQSYVRSRSPIDFVLKRIARIYPGAVVCLLIIALVMGPLVTTLPVRKYLVDGQVYCYLSSNWTFIRIPAISESCGALPGVFLGNRISGVPDGSLWTLYVEIVCYAYVLAFGLLGFLTSRGRIAAALIGLLVWHALAPHTVPYFSDDHYTDVLKVGLFFMAGVAAYALRDIIAIRARYAVVLIVVAAVLQHTPVQEYALYVALFYLTLVVASSPRALALRLPGDYSFGVYIYAWPIQQVVNHHFPTLTSYPSNLICIPAALLAGYLSWTFIEKPALDAAHRWAARQRQQAASVA